VEGIVLRHQSIRLIQILLGRPLLGMEVTIVLIPISSHILPLLCFLYKSILAHRISFLLQPAHNLALTGGLHRIVVMYKGVPILKFFSRLLLVLKLENHLVQVQVILFRGQSLRR